MVYLFPSPLGTSRSLPREHTPHFGNHCFRQMPEYYIGKHLDSISFLLIIHVFVFVAYLTMLFSNSDYTALN
jgi:hypothetical protein